MPALIAITEDVGAREEKCAHCGEVIGIVDFIVRVSQHAAIDFVHLDCDRDVKQHVEELRRNGRVSERIAKQAQTITRTTSRFAGKF